MNLLKNKLARLMLILVAVITIGAVNSIQAKAADSNDNYNQDYDTEVNLYGAGNPYEAIFDPAFYANRYADVKAAFGSNASLLLQHFLQCGVNEGRQGCADFDPYTYRYRYSDLNAAYGDNMKLYYVHYLQIGKAEGRSGKPQNNSNNTNSTNNTNTTTINTTNSKYANAYDIMMSFKSSFPEGMRYTNADFYRWNGGIYYGGYGCAGFAFMLSDAVFGNNPARIHYDINNIRVGDILRINGDTHSVIVLSVNSDGIVVTEANYNSSVHWGRTFSWSSLARCLDYVMTRYDD